MELPLTFLGVQSEKPMVSIIPLPLDNTTSYIKGTHFGPERIITASRYMEDYDIEEGVETLSVFTEPFTTLSHHTPTALQQIRERVSNRRCEQFVAIGGEHLITLPIVQAVQPHTVVVLDAHTDFRDSYEGTRFSHATVMKRVWELNSVKNIVWIGARAVSVEEHHVINELGLTVFWAFENWNTDSLIKHVKGRDVYLSIDLDVLDPSIMPAVGTPEPNGLSFQRVMEVVRAVFSHSHVVGADVVEFSPLPFVQPDFIAARLVQKLVALYLKNNSTK